MSKAEKLFTDLINKTAGAELSQMFGKPCGKLNKKAFICFFEEAIVFKIGLDNCEEWLLAAKGSKNFDPSGKGRAMIDWLQAPTTNKKYFEELLSLSLEFTFSK